MLIEKSSERIIATGIRLYHTYPLITSRETVEAKGPSQ